MSDLYSGFRSSDYPIIGSDAHGREPSPLWPSRAPASSQPRDPSVEHSDERDLQVRDGRNDKPPIGPLGAAGPTNGAGLGTLDCKAPRGPDAGPETSG